MYRPTVAENASYLEHVVLWSRCSKSKKAEDDEGVHPFLEAHPMSNKSHAVKRTEKQAANYIPLIKFCRFPRISELGLGGVYELANAEEKAVIDKKRNTYGRGACVLTVPLRVDDDLHYCLQDNHNDWWDTWQKNKHKATLQGITFLRAQEYYHSTKSSNFDYLLPEGLDDHKNASNDLSDDGDIEVDIEDGMFEALDERLAAAQEMTHAIKSLDAAGALHIPTPAPSDINYDKYNVDTACAALHDEDTQPVEEQKEQTYVDLPDPWHISQIERQTLITDIHEAITDAAVAVDDSADEKTHFTAPKPLPRRPTIAAACQAWSLCEEQCFAVKQMAAAWLYSLLPMYDLDGKQEAKQILEELYKYIPECRRLVMSLTGPGGTGKSHVIGCFKAFCVAWGAGYTLRLTGTTGIASCLIGGATYHSTLGFVRGNTSKKTLREKEHALRMVTFILIDEVSMMGAWDIARIDKRLRALKGKDAPFGGLHIVFCGDFGQLPPVRQKAMYHRGVVTGARRLEILRGIELWKTELNASVVLKCNHRAKEDRAFADLLSRLRVGRPTEKDLELLNSRVISRGVTVPPSVNSTKPLTVITPGNKERIAINAQALLQRCEYPGTDSPWSNGMPILIEAHIESSVPVSSTFRKVMLSVGEERLKWNFSPSVRIISGTPYLHTVNTSVSRGLANGMLAEVVQVGLYARLH